MKRKEYLIRVIIFPTIFPAVKRPDFGDVLKIGKSVSL
jgi:hypothetical protein